MSINVTPTINVGNPNVKISPSLIEERFGIELTNEQTQKVIDELSLLLLIGDTFFLQDKMMDWLEDEEWIIEYALGDWAELIEEMN
jgi:hypothetical protein